MNQATERIQASRPSRRPLHISCLQALVTVALVRSTCFSPVRTSASSPGQAPAGHVMAFAPPPVSPITSRTSRPFDTNDNHATTALHMAPPPPGKRGREIEIRRKVSEMLDKIQINIGSVSSFVRIALGSAHRTSTDALIIHRLWN